MVRPSLKRDQQKVLDERLDAIERELSAICRKVARKVVVEGASFSEEITPDKVTQYLGVPRFRNTMAEEKNEIGLATGLAWTEVGGDLLTIESAVMPGKGNITRTGSLGDVMKESVEAARTVVRSRARVLGIKDDMFEKKDIHIHVPDGATIGFDLERDRQLYHVTESGIVVVEGHRTQVEVAAMSV
mgnify:CR=1 FL=1